jgi:hypothetical protein
MASRSLTALLERDEDGPLAGELLPEASADGMAGTKRYVDDISEDPETHDTGADTAARDSPIDVSDDSEEDAGFSRARSSSSKKREQGFRTLRLKHPWINPDDVELYVKRKHARCLICKTQPLSLAGGNAGRHASSASHNANVATQESILKGKATVLDAYVSSASIQKAAALSKERLTRQRKLFTFVGHTIAPKSTLQALFTGAMGDAAASMRAAGVFSGAAGTVDRDVMDAYEMVKEDVITALKGQVGALVTDGASTKFCGRQKPLAIVFSNSELGAVLLDVVMEEDGSAEAAAAAIEDTLKAFGIDKRTQITCCMGDNVTFNDKLARILGIPRGKCIPHSLALVFKAVTTYFPSYATLTAGISAALTAGGGTRHFAELRKLGVDPSRLICYPNRWGSLAGVAKYLMSAHEDYPHGGGVLQQVREYFMRVAKESEQAKAKKSSKQPGAQQAAPGRAAGTRKRALVTATSGAPASGSAAAAAAAEGETDTEDEAEIDTEDEVVDEAKAQARVQSKRLKALADALDSATAASELWIVSHITEGLSELIVQASARPGHVDPTLLDKLEALQCLLEGCATPGREELIVDSALDDSPFEVDKKAAVQLRYKGIVHSAAAAAVAKYQKHVSPATRMLKQRFRLDPQNAPDPVPEPADGKQLTRQGIQEFFGCLPEDAGNSLYTQYELYCSKWRTGTYGKEAAQMALTDEYGKRRTPTLTMAGFWKRHTEFPLLAKLGAWYAEMPTSSVDAERVFGQMRAMEAPNRMRMRSAAFKAELFGTVNRSFAEGALLAANYAVKLQMPGLSK